jgi:hypothetical protein
MSLYVYAIADGPVALDNLRGAAGEPLHLVASGDGGAHAIAGDFVDDFAGASAGPPALTADTLLAQDALVRNLAVRADALLPARFGARFADERALRRTLDDLAPRLDRALTRVRGREQMTIRLFHTSSPSPVGPARPSVDDSSPLVADSSHSHSSIEAPLPEGEASADAAANDDAHLGPGTRYMRRRAAEERRLPAAIEELRKALADVVDDERVERGQSGERGQSIEQGQSPVIGSIHHLIPRGTAARYRARLEEAAASPQLAASGIRFRVSGPSPAYAFAEADLS